MIGNIGPMELFIILLLVLVLFGAKRLPEMGASIGKGIREFKRSLGEAGSAADIGRASEEAEAERIPRRLSGS